MVKLIPDFNILAMGVIMFQIEIEICFKGRYQGHNPIFKVSLHVYLISEFTSTDLSAYFKFNIPSLAPSITKRYVHSGAVFPPDYRIEAVHCMVIDIN